MAKVVITTDRRVSSHCVDMKKAGMIPGFFHGAFRSGSIVSYAVGVASAALVPASASARELRSSRNTIGFMFAAI